MGGWEKLLLVKQENKLESGIWFVLCDNNYKIRLLFQTNDVNQGDALEHDFSALYLALTFPVRHLLDANLSQVYIELPCYINLYYYNAQ